MGELIPLTGKAERSYLSRFNAQRIDKSFNFKLEKQYLAECAKQNPDILECAPDSIGETLVEAAALGLTFHSQMAHAYPVPYKINGEKRLSLSVGYRGMTHMVQKAGTLIGAPQAVLVHKNDPVYKVWTDETGRHIRHEQARDKRGPVTHAYCIARFRDGGYHIEEMTADELDACFKAATSRNTKGGYAWKGAFKGEMQKKCVIRRAWKHWPKDEQGILQHAMEVMDRVEPMDFGDDGGDGITVNDEDVLEMHALLTDNGLPSEKADQWLEKIASVNGLNDIHNLPLAHKERVLSDLRAHLDTWKANQQAE